MTQVKVVRHTVYTFHSLIADTFAIRGRVFLAGDAAHMMPPFQGQGMNSGIRDAANLAWKLAAVLKRQVGPAVLESYEQERKPHAAEMIQLSRRVGQILMTRNPLVAWLRDMAFGATSRLPAARRYLSGGAFKPAPRALKGFFATSPDGRAGRLFIQPDVLDLQGRRQRLDDVMGPGFVLLRIAAAEDQPFAAFTHPLWDRLSARRVCLLPGGLSALPAGADVVAADIAGEAAAWAGERRPVTLLLRPDRYVAAVIAPGQEDAVATSLDRLAPLA
jgi:3-(3-hydroxy-phenyl)propionate hydroxylase